MYSCSIFVRKRAWDESPSYFQILKDILHHIEKVPLSQFEKAKYPYYLLCKSLDNLFMKNLQQKFFYKVF